MPSGESVLAFVAFEKYHVVKWLESISDSFQNTTSKFRPVLRSSHGHITVATESQLIRETIVTVCTNLGPESFSFFSCVSNVLR